MKHLTRLIIAIFLGLAAAGVNSVYLSHQKTMPLYVGAKTNIAESGSVTEETLLPVAVPGSAAVVSKSFIPWGKRSVLLGTSAIRKFRAGDLFLYRDIQTAESDSNWEILGPYRVVGVGSNFKDDLLQKQKISGGGNNITIEVNADFDEKTDRLLQIINPARDATTPQIAYVQSVPKAEVELAEKALRDTAGGRYIHQTISLRGIEYDPTVVISGAVIRFVLPASKAYSR